MLETIFNSFWSFIGFVIIISIIGDFIIELTKVFKKDN